MDQILLLSQGILAILVGFIVEGLKQAGLDLKYKMITRAIIGAIIGLFYAIFSAEHSPIIGAFGALLSGAVASGFYSGGKEYQRENIKDTAHS